MQTGGSRPGKETKPRFKDTVRNPPRLLLRSVGARRCSRRHRPRSAPSVGHRGAISARGPERRGIRESPRPKAPSSSLQRGLGASPIRDTRLARRPHRSSLPKRTLQSESSSRNPSGTCGRILPRSTVMCSGKRWSPFPACRPWTRNGACVAAPSTRRSSRFFGPTAGGPRRIPVRFVPAVGARTRWWFTGRTTSSRSVDAGVAA